jgi:TctA family transporter
MMENSLRQALLMSAGSPVIFFERPLSAILMGTAIFLLVFPLIPKFQKKRPALGE